MSDLVNKKIVSLHMCHLVGNDEGAGQTLVSVKGAAPFGVARPSDGRVSWRPPYIRSSEPDGDVVVSFPRRQGSVKTSIPTVNVLQRLLGVSRFDHALPFVFVEEQLCDDELHVGIQRRILVDSVDLSDSGSIEAKL